MKSKKTAAAVDAKKSNTEKMEILQKANDRICYVASKLSWYHEKTMIIHNMLICAKNLRESMIFGDCLQKPEDDLKHSFLSLLEFYGDHKKHDMFSELETEFLEPVEYMIWRRDLTFDEKEIFNASMSGVIGMYMDDNNIERISESIKF